MKTAWLTVSCLITALLLGCAGSPPTQWYELRAAPPEAVMAPASSDAPVWELSPRIDLPGALDRDTLMVARGGAGLVPLEGHRWAEPLRDSVPRLLLADLRALRGADRVWAAPAPAATGAAQRLVVGIERLQVQPDQRRLVITARATWQAVGAGMAPVSRTFSLEEPLTGLTPDTIATAHRLVLWRLARQLASGP